MYRTILFAIILGAVGHAAAALPETFDRYRVIVDRQPFGKPPVAEKNDPVDPVVQPEPDFAKDLRLCSIVEDESGEIIVGMANDESKKTCLLRKGVLSEEGFELLEADYEAGEVVLRWGAQVATICFGPLQAAPVVQSRSPSHSPRDRKRPASRRLNETQKD